MTRWPSKRRWASCPVKLNDKVALSKTAQGSKDQAKEGGAGTSEGYRRTSSQHAGVPDICARRVDY